MRVIPKILIIDDDRFFLEFYKAELSQYNFAVEFAKDGEEGLVKAQEIMPDLILLDVILPKKDGFEVLETLKKDEKTKEIPVIIISTLGMQSDVDKLLKLGAIEAFNKLTNLPNQVAKYIMELFESGAIKAKNEEAPKVENESTKLAADQINVTFKDSLDQIGASLEKMFQKKAHLEDMNASLIPFVKFKENVQEIAKSPGTIFIYADIKATESGMALLVMKRDNVLSLIRLIEKGTSGKEMGLEISDRVIEEFFNIIINAFLTKLSKSVSGKLLLESANITNAQSIFELIGKLAIADNNLVVFLEEAYDIEELDLTFSIYVTFSGGLFQKNNEKK